MFKLNLYLTLKKCKRDTSRMMMNMTKNNPASRLEPYHTSTIQRKTYDPPPPIEIDGEQQYEVDYILDLKIFKSRILFIGMV